MRLIDADAIIEKKWQAESEACFYALEDVVSVTDIEEAPTIDIVLCKECKWSDMAKYIKLEGAIERRNQLYHGYEVEERLNSLPTIEVSEDCINRERTIERIKRNFYGDNQWVADEVEMLLLNAPSVVPSRANVECYVRTCEKNKNGRCEATDIILEFGCGE